MDKQELMDKSVDEWLKPDATVRVKSHGQLLKVYKITEDSGVRCNDGNYYCRTNLEPHGNGWVNGLKYGVEYPTNGEKPDLPDDVLVERQGLNSKTWFSLCSSWAVRWDNCSAFRIVDDRYKPKDTESQENKKENSEDLIDFMFNIGIAIANSVSRNEWSWHERGELPPVGALVDVVGDVQYGAGEECCEVIAHVENCAVIRMAFGLGCFESRVLLPAKTEREKFVEAALKQFDAISEKFPPTENAALKELYGNMHDAGFKAPDEKSRS